ncbi:MAG: ABC transporter permease [Anaerolineae bacterium]|nr:ABC transporter permease [Anaerolineae bacterium]
MRKIWLIARHEYLHNLKKRSFLLSAFGLPIVMVAIMVLSVALSEETFTSTGKLGSIGFTDQADPPLIAETYTLPDGYIAYATEDAAKAAFEAGELGAYFVITENYWNDGMVQFYTAAESIPEGTESQIGAMLRENVANYAPERFADRMSNPVELTFRTVGGGLEVTGESAMAVIFMPIIFGMIFMMATTTTSQFLMQSVVTEKENRIMEILVTSCSPEQLMSGKVLGLGALGLTQVLIWAIVGVIFIVAAGESSPFISAIRLPPVFIVIMLAYFVLGYMLQGSVMAGVGAAVTAEQEGRQFASLFSLLSVLPMILTVSFMQDPNGAIPVILSLFPFTAPISMLMRLPVANIPAWQMGLSFLLLIVGTILCVWIAARIFRLGMLMYGKRLGLRDLWTVIRSGLRGPAPMTSVAGERGKGELM